MVVGNFTLWQQITSSHPKQHLTDEYELEHVTLEIMKANRFVLILVQLFPPVDPQENDP